MLSFDETAARLTFAEPTELPGGRAWTAVMTDWEPDRLGILVFTASVTVPEQPPIMMRIEVADPGDDWRYQPGMTRWNIDAGIRKQLGIARDERPLCP